MKQKIASIGIIFFILSLFLIPSVLATVIPSGRLGEVSRDASAAKVLPYIATGTPETFFDPELLGLEIPLSIDETGISIPDGASVSYIFDQFKAVAIAFNNLFDDSKQQLDLAYCRGDEEEIATIKFGLTMFSIFPHAVQLQAQSYVDEYEGTDEGVADSFRTYVLTFSELQFKINELISNEPNLQKLCPGVFPYSELTLASSLARSSGRPLSSPFDGHLPGEGAGFKVPYTGMRPPASSGSSTGDGSGDGSSGGSSGDGSSSSGSSSGSSGSSGSTTTPTTTTSTTTNTYSRNSAENALEEAEEELEDAEDAIDTAKEAWRRGLSMDVDDDDIDDAEEEIDQAWDVYEEAERLISEGSYDQAIQRADEAKEMAEDIIRDMNYTSTSSYRSGRSAPSGNDVDSGRYEQYSDRAPRSSSADNDGYVFQTVDDYQPENDNVPDEPVIVVRTQQPIGKTAVSSDNSAKNVVAGVFLAITALLAIGVIVAAVLVLRKSAKEE